MFVRNRRFALRADTDAGATDTFIDPGITGGLIDSGDTHIDVLALGDG